VGPSTLGAHADEGDNHESERGQDEEDRHSLMGGKTDVAEGPSEPMALGVSKRFFDLHALGVESDDNASVAAGQRRGEQPGIKCGLAELSLFFALGRRRFSTRLSAFAHEHQPARNFLLNEETMESKVHGGRGRSRVKLLLRDHAPVGSDGLGGATNAAEEIPAQL
jgi:hypothetical protein